MNNFTQTSNFKVFLPFIQDEQFNVQSVELPGISFTLPEVFAQSGKRALLTGDSINFDPVTIEFLLDEKLITYKKILKWFLESINPNSGVIDNKDFMCGIEMTDNAGHSLICLQLFGCKFESIGSVNLTSNSEDNEITLSVTMRFDDLEFVDYLDPNKFKIKK